MSQTEILMIFALGVFTTLFVLLLFGRTIWNAMRRWSRWQQNKAVPDTIRDLEAQRDGMRAENALMAHKLESSTADMKMKLAEQTAEVARNRNRVLELVAAQQKAEQEVARLQEVLRARDVQVAALNRQIEENVKAINQAWAAPQQRDGEQLPAAPVTTAMFGVEREQKGNDPFTVRAPAPAAAAAEAVEPAPSAGFFSNAFERRFNAIAGNLAPQQPEPVVAAAVETSPAPLPVAEVDISRGSDTVNEGVSNVLSIAQRLRDLQKGMKS